MNHPADIDTADVYYKLDEIEEKIPDLRDYFAAKAMQGILSNREMFLSIIEDGKNVLPKKGKDVTDDTLNLFLAQNAYRFSDAMMEARK